MFRRNGERLYVCKRLHAHAAWRLNASSFENLIVIRLSGGNKLRAWLMLSPAAQRREVMASARYCGVPWLSK